ncbi:hypothetical protein QR98_0008940 [Sarcoptes scabiei]|nr:hypothetical protein QR98_0008940 [Sarcoptes scabiei]
MWECNFEIDACHFRNQHNLAPFNRYFNNRNPLFGRKGLLLLNLNSRRVQKFPGSRLISHYFPSRYREACLFISYYATGYGAQNFYVIQQDKENKCIFADRRLQQKLNRWNEIEIQLDLRDGDPRFFLEIHYNKNIAGLFAIGRFSFGHGVCRQPQPNQC